MIKKASDNCLKLLSLIALACFTASCGVFSDLGGNTQSTTKIVASSFISALYGTSTKTFSVNVNDVDHIASMGLEQAGDYNYFVINSYTYGGKMKENPYGTSTEIFNNISLPSTGATTSGTKTLQITITYTPLVAIEADNKPHEATLMIAYDLPTTGVIAITLEGYTQGIAESKCAGASVSNAQAYTFTDNKIDFYLCDDNSPLVEANVSDVSTHTNYAEIKMDAGAQFTFYQVDDSTLCIMGTNSSGLTPSIPNFDFTAIPEATAELIGDSIGISLAKNSSAECSLSSGQILCDEDITLTKLLGAVDVSPLTLTNGATQPTSEDCDHFPAQQGSGSYPNDALKLIAWGYIIPSSIVDVEDLQGGNALVVVEINLDAPAQ